MRRALLLAVLALALGCAAPPREVPLFARARLATDFETYAIRRVGLLPVRVPGGRVAAASGEAAFLQQRFATQVELGTPYEVVTIAEHELAEVPDLEPRREGRNRAAAVVELTRRFALDGLLVVEVVEQHPYAPQRIAVHAELIASETGASVWSADVHLDGRDPRVRDGLEAYASRELDADDEADRWDLVLLSPRRFAEFALWQIAQML